MTPQQPDATLNWVFSAVRTLLITLGTSLVAGGVLTVHSQLYFWLMFVSGSIMVIGPAAWGVWASIQHVLQAKQNLTAGVQAGINLVVAGEALTVDGKKIPGGTGDGKPLPVTPASAAAIVKTFA